MSSREFTLIIVITTLIALITIGGISSWCVTTYNKQQIEKERLRIEVETDLPLNPLTEESNI